MCNPALVKVNHRKERRPTSRSICNQHSAEFICSFCSPLSLPSDISSLSDKKIALRPTCSQHLYSPFPQDRPTVTGLSSSPEPLPPPTLTQLNSSRSTAYGTEEGGRRKEEGLSTHLGMAKVEGPSREPWLSALPCRPSTWEHTRGLWPKRGGHNMLADPGLRLLLGLPLPNHLCQKRQCWV